MESSTTDVIELLDKTIAKTTDLNLLNDLLNMKLSTSKTRASKINFSPVFVLANETVDFDLVFDILRKSFKISENHRDLLLNIVKYITNKHNDVKYQLNIIKLLSYLIPYHTESDSLFEYVRPDFLRDFLIRSLNNSEIKSKAYETLSSYLKLFPRIEQIKCLNEVFDFCCQDNNLDIFCALLTHISVDLIYDKSCCFNNDSFWLYMASCISGSESHLQKQGEHVLSKYIQNTRGINTINEICSSNDFDNSWQAFIILIDIGREKQLHLVTPSLNLFKYVSNLSFIWQKCVYGIYLRHSQISIVYQVVIEILKRKYSGDNLKEILKIVFPAINNNEYTDLSCQMFETLQNHCAGFSKAELDIVMHELVQIPWTAVSFWKAIQNVFTQENKASVNADLLQEVIRCATNLPHVYIRTKCIKYLINLFWDENDYYKMCKFIAVLKSSDDVNLQHLERCYFSKSIIDIVVKVLHDVSDIQTIETCFIILTRAHINIWPYLRDYDSELNPHVELFIWKDYLSGSPMENFSILLRQLKTFLLTYFADYLLEEFTNLFIEVYKLLALKSSLLEIDLLVDQVLRKPFSSTDGFNQNQIYAALVLMQECSLYPGERIEIKETRGLIVIDLFKNNDVVNSIEGKDPSICIECINLLFKLNKTPFSTRDTKNIIEVFTKLFDLFDNKVIYNLYAKLNDLLVSSASSNCIHLVIDFINVCHHHLLHIKKDKYFRRIVKEFINVIYSEVYLSHNSNNIASINNHLLELCKSYPLIRLDWITSLEKMCNVNARYHQEVCFVPVVDINLQGVVVTKNERTEFNLCQEFLQGTNDICESNELGDFYNPNHLNIESRLVALKILMYVGRHHDIELMTTCLRERYMRHFKKRYFPDSKIHCEKLRILQALLTLLFNVEMSEEECKKMSAFVFQCVEEETNQNCVKQLLNWILILVLKDVSAVLEWIESRGTNISPSVLISIIPSMYHLALTGGEEDIEKVVRVALPWTMGAQFKLRLYAQDLIRRILQHAKRNDYQNFLTTYQHLEECLVSCVESAGDMVLNTMKSDILFLNDFDPRDRSVSTLFYDIPRLNKVCPTEWRNFADGFDTESVTNRIFADKIDHFLSLNDSNTQKLEAHANRMLDIQKKTTPWKSVLESTNARAKTDFILIASLVDKSQNLGGLSRTCEVFGLPNIVFNDVKVIREKEFKSLSMSSEAWINAVEVKVKQLTEYILTLQSEGYCVIGAEQTAGSKKLNEFRFPIKVALILGNEKTGIPPEVIPLLNVCLEIPQFGQTRSLNVHVAGATFVWEYAKQHLV